MNFKKKIFNCIASLFGVGIMSVSSTLATPGDFLVYFVGKDNYKLYEKKCCMCKEDLEKRCIQFCCKDGCRECCYWTYCKFNHNFSFPNQDKLISCLSDRCTDEKVADVIESHGYFCFIDKNNSMSYDNAFESACSKEQLCCAYCIKDYLKNRYSIKKGGIEGVSWKNISDKKGIDGDCTICLLELYDGKSKVKNDFTYCKNCNVAFHFGCFISWWNSKKNCPICKSDYGIAYNKVGFKAYSNIDKLPEVFDLLGILHCEKCKLCQEDEEYLNMFQG